MKHIIDEIHVRGSKNDRNVVPSTKQTEEITTNISIECGYCSRFVGKILRIVSIADVVINHRVLTLNHCCYRCADGLNLKDMMAFIDKDNNRYSPELVMQGLPLNEYGWLADNTKSRVNELDKYRNKVVKMRRISKDLGLFMPTFKQEMMRKRRKLEGKVVSTFDYSDPFWAELSKVSKTQ